MEEAVTLGHIMLTGAQNKSRYSTDAHRHSSKLWPHDAEKLHLVPRGGVGGASLTHPAKQMLNLIFAFSLA